MKFGLLIFLLAFIIRFINLLFLDLNPETYLVEDQIFYWELSLKGAYLVWSDFPSIELTERMPGSFWFFEFLQWITNKNLFLILIFQSIVDSLTCVIIYNCAGLINKKYQLYTGIFAVISPLMIIISSQILSDTIFLFVFSCSLYCILKYSKSSSLYYLMISGLMLGLSAFIRATAFPFIFLALPIIFFIIQTKEYNSKRLVFSFFIFLILSFLPISHRFLSNVTYNNTFSLTSQSGSHSAYWMVPGVLSLSEKYTREEAIAYINHRVDKEGGLKGDPYKDSKKLFSISMDILSELRATDIVYSWARASFLNIITSAVLIDMRVRKLQHFSFADEGKIRAWFNKNYSNKESSKYLLIFFISIFFSIFTAFSFIIGFSYFIKMTPMVAILAIFIILYFSLITGPTLSPKYCVPFLPIIFYVQSIFFNKLLNFIKKKLDEL